MWVFSIRVPVLRCFGSVMVAWRAAAGGVQQRRGGVAGGVGRRLHLSAALVGSVEVKVKTWTTTAADAVPSLEASSLTSPFRRPLDIAGENLTLFWLVSLCLVAYPS